VERRGEERGGRGRSLEFSFFDDGLTNFQLSAEYPILVQVAVDSMSVDGTGDPDDPRNHNRQRLPG
jgi:hypothetical protein